MMSPEISGQGFTKSFEVQTQNHFYHEEVVQGLLCGMEEDLTLSDRGKSGPLF